MVGHRADDAAGWAGRHDVSFRAELGLLRSGFASTLLSNYVVTRQYPLSGASLHAGVHYLLVVRAVQGVPAMCTPPVATPLVASDGEVVVTQIGNPVFSGRLIACLRANGERRVLADSTFTEMEARSWSMVRLTGHFVALERIDAEVKYGNACSATVAIDNVHTGSTRDAFSGPCPNIDSLTVGGDGFAVWHVRLPATATSTALDIVSCASISFCVAIDDRGRALTSSTPTGAASGWALEAAEAARTGISCPSTNLCVSVDGGALGSTISVSTDPLGQGAAWTTTQLAAPGLFAVSCPSAMLCVAAGASMIAASTDPANASSWRTFGAPASGIMGISCPTVNLCLARGGHGEILTSSDPTAGASAWRTSAIVPPGNSLGDISCPTSSFCAVSDFSGYVLTSSDPTGSSTTWSDAAVGNALTRVSCASNSLCAVGSLSGLWVTTAPSTPGKPWIKVLDAPNIQAVSCPTATFCAAVDTSGNVFTSTDPSHPTSWRSQPVDVPTCAPCQPEQILANDRSGTHVLDSTPPGTGTQLTDLRLDRARVTWLDGGQPRQATLH